MTRSRMGLAVAGGVAVVVLVLVVLWKVGGPFGEPTVLTRQVGNIKTTVGTLQVTFGQGELQQKMQGGRNGEGARPDLRMAIVMLGLDKLRSQINHYPDEPWHKSALDKTDEALHLMREVGPKYQQAVDRQDKSAAKGFVDYMTRLDKQLDELLVILHG